MSFSFTYRFESYHSPTNPEAQHHQCPLVVKNQTNIIRG
jgi:hypothetical protein